MKTVGLWLLSAGAALAQTAEVAVSAGRHDRWNSPVRVELPEALAGARVAVVRDASGRNLPAQVTEAGLLSASGRRELHFVVPTLKAGETAVFKVSTATVAAAGFRWEDVPGKHQELRLGDRPVLRYMCAPLDESSPAARVETYKVFHHLYDPEGKRFVTNGAGGRYPHHRGIFYGFNKVTYGDGKTCDVWHCTGQAHQAHEGFLAREEGPVLGRHRAAIRWHGREKEVFAREERELTVYDVPGGTLVEFASRLRPMLAPVKLDGDPQHAGFHFRADSEVNDKSAKQTFYLRPDGAGKPGETRNWPAQKEHVNLPWNAMSFVLDGKRYTAAYLDRPENPKEARFSERDYGRFGSYFVHELAAGKALEVNYRLWLQEGEMKVADVAAMSAAFADPPRAAVK